MTTYPNVPNVPGVPPIPRNPFASSAPTLELLTTDPISLLTDAFTPQWGIYKNGVPVIQSDNTVSFEFRQAWAIADFPVEQGGFQSYDKVNTPFDARVRVSSGGSESNRQALIASVEAIVDSIDTYDLVTPLKVYPNVNAQHWDYAQTAQNTGLLSIDIRFLEIRQTATQTFSQTDNGVAPLQNTKDPASASPVNAGTVQTKPFTGGGGTTNGAGASGAW
mgnify:CR=1 FL=1